MIIHRFAVQFHTPAFLGDATQSGQWRTPPFKAQLRQWWRVAYSKSKEFKPNIASMREAEGKLFGNAWLEDSFSKSLVRIRLSHWDAGKLKSWQDLEQDAVEHPDVPHKVGPHAYLGYGPLDGRSGTKFSPKVNAAIQAGEHSTLSMSYPAEHSPLIEQSLLLMHRFGAVGGRSRNGWGSYSLQAQENSSAPNGALPLCDWKACLEQDWPRAIGKDDHPLIWTTPIHDDWKLLMRDLAVIKIKLRTQFAFTTGKDSPRAEGRHWLSYPVTNHSVKAWGNNARLPNTLRFKIRPIADGRLVGVIFHMPCVPPKAFHPDLKAIEAVWLKVHHCLDALTSQLTRSEA